MCGGSLSEGGWLICPHRFEEEHSCFRLCVLLVLVAPGVRCGFVLLCVRLCACVFWGVKSLMVLVEGCDCGGFWVNRFSSGNQDCAWGLCTEFQDFSDAVFKFVYFYSIFAYDFSVKYTYFRLALSDSYSPSQLVSLIADFTITHVLPSQPPGTFLRASFWWNEINRFEFLFFLFTSSQRQKTFLMIVKQDKQRRCISCVTDVFIISVLPRKMIGTVDWLVLNNWLKWVPLSRGVARYNWHLGFNPLVPYNGSKASRIPIN